MDSVFLYLLVGFDKSCRGNLRPNLHKLEGVFRTVIGTKPAADAAFVVSHHAGRFFVMSSVVLVCTKGTEFDTPAAEIAGSVIALD